MGPIDCPETSVQNYHYKLCNILEERRPHLQRGGSLESCINDESQITEYLAFVCSMQGLISSEVCDEVMQSINEKLNFSFSATQRH
jgi:hypothetical protein